uniref:Uncharacterized protein n=1 Tax=Candidatus Kentrum sp. DK TaxID=2126562 RepID=A0A450TFD3_9GAMM|nr:MAG: hypothetical protein BECKDK2373B_GA0170837_11549 [Candidatus Kentron sp. DK]
MKEKNADNSLSKSDDAQEDSHGHSESEANGSKSNISQHPEILEELPPEMRKDIKVAMSMMQRFGPTHHPLGVCPT